MKNVWAIELDILSEVIRICKKYKIKYFADGGTLLGAIRHNGMIPWDDDIDIGMLREEYVKFKQVASTELKFPYFFQDETSDPGSLTGHGRVLNSTTTAINKYHFNKKTQGDCFFKQCIFVDIFAFDYVPDNEFECESFIEEVYKTGKNLWNYSKQINRNMIIDETVVPTSFKEYEDLMSKYMNQPSNRLFGFAGGRKNLIKYSYLKSEVENLIMHDFEFLNIPVVSDYNTKLTRIYGNWHEFVIGTSAHGGINDIFFDTEHPCEYYLEDAEKMNKIKEKFGIND